MALGAERITMWDQTAVDRWYQENLARGVSKSKLDAMVQQKQADYLVGQGMPARELQTSPIGLRAQTQEIAGGGYKPKSTTTTKEAGTLRIQYAGAESGLKALDKMETILSGPTGKEQIIKSKLPLAIGARTYKQAGNEIKDVLARLRTGAVINTEEEKLYRSYLPGALDTPEDVRYKVNLFRDFFNSLARPESQRPMTEKPLATQGIPSALAGILMPQTKQYAQKAMAGELAVQQKPMSFGQQLASGAGPLGMLAAGRGDILKETAGSALELSFLYSLLSGAKGLLKGGAGKAMASLSPKKAVGELKKKAISEAEISGGISGEKIIQATDDLVKNASGSLRGQLAELATKDKSIFSKKAISVTDASRKLEIANIASKYNARGQAASTAEAIYNETIGNAIRSELQRVAPGVAKANKLFSILYKAPQTIQRGSWLALKASGIGKLLGL